MISRRVGGARCSGIGLRGRSGLSRRALVVQRHWEEAYEIPIESGDGGHGGGDELLLSEVFGAPGHDPLARAADWTDGIRSIAVGIAGNRSLETGAPVKVNELGIPLLAVR
ncbi:hypothetical protein AKG07_09775 [Microbacterium sp. CGR1]|nr:hypothetical protein AKG07_09775 [Microbacterium sp. CGR1]